MNCDEIRAFFEYVSDSIFLKVEENEVSLRKFIPGDCYIYLTLNSAKGGDPVAYMDYDPRTKTIKGINRYLLPKVITFLSRTNNHHLIKEVKEALQ